MSKSTGYETWTIEDHGTVTLAGTTYSVSVQRFANGKTDTTLTGPRGAVYILRGYIEKGGDTGLREVISWKSGKPLTRNSRPVRVVEIAGIIEEYKAGTR